MGGPRGVARRRPAALRELCGLSLSSGPSQPSTRVRLRLWGPVWRRPSATSTSRATQLVQRLSSWQAASTSRPDRASNSGRTSFRRGAAFELLAASRWSSMRPPRTVAIRTPSSTRSRTDSCSPRSASSCGQRFGGESSSAWPPSPPSQRLSDSSEIPTQCCWRSAGGSRSRRRSPNGAPGEKTGARHRHAGP